MKRVHRECKKPCKVPPGSKNCVSLKGLKISSLKTDEYLFYPIESHLSNSWLLSLPSLLSYSFDSQIKGENCFFSILLLSPNYSFPKLMAPAKKRCFQFTPEFDRLSSALGLLHCVSPLKRSPEATLSPSQLQSHLLITSPSCYLTSPSYL